MKIDSELVNRFILWKPVKVVSVIWYALIIIMIPFNAFWAAILLFALICFWSRIPCLISMFTKDLEVVDFFTVMLAINAGGFLGGLFGASIMLFSRIFGPNEWYLYTIKDAAAIFIGGIISPLVYAIVGSPLFTLYTFTAIRYVMYLILTVVLEPEYIGLEIGLCATGIFTAYISNTLIMKYFEGPLTRTFEGGLHFSWELMIYTTLVVGFFYEVSRVAKWYELRKLARMKPEKKFTDEELRWNKGTGVGLYKYHHNTSVQASA